MFSGLKRILSKSHSHKLCPTAILKGGLPLKSILMQVLLFIILIYLLLMVNVAASYFEIHKEYSCHSRF